MNDLIPLLNNIKIAVSEHCRFTTDSVLLSRFAAPSPKERVCDLCSGTGIVPLLWQAQGERPPLHTLCVELDPLVAELIEESIEYNDLASRMSVLRCDLRTLQRPPDGKEVDLVTCNPPYFVENSGEAGERAMARQELYCTAEDVCAAASRLLKFGGRLCLCQRPDRLVDVIVAMRRFKIEPKRVRLVCHREGKVPFLLLVEGKKGAYPGLNFLPPLFLEENGLPNEEYLKMCRKL